MEYKDYELLKKRELLDVLIGDSSCGTFSSSNKDALAIKLSYLSGPKICDLASDMGITGISYEYSGGLSRWMYMELLIDECIKTNKISELLLRLLDKGLFITQNQTLDITDRDAMYDKYLDGVIGFINSILDLSPIRIVRTSNNYLIQNKNPCVETTIPTISQIDSAYILDVAQKAKNDITEKNFDSAITKSRTILEEVFCYVIEQKGEKPNDSGDIMRLFKQVKQLYDMHENSSSNNSFQKLLGGLNAIVGAVAEIRNCASDAHGVGNERIFLEEYHVRLVVNSSMSMAEFILELATNTLESMNEGC